MNNIKNQKPDWIKWESEVILDNTITKVLDDYGDTEYFFRMVSYGPFVLQMEFEEIRDAVTAFNAYGYRENKLYDGKYFERIDEMNNTKYHFNQWFNSHLSANMLDLYEFFDSKYKTEKWAGGCRYNLLNRTNGKGYTEMSCLKAAVRFQHLQDENPKLLTSIGSAKMLSRYLDTPYWGFGEENNFYNYDPDKSKEEFEICNNMMRREIQKQDDFITAIFVDGDIDKAYNIMPSKDKIDL